MNGQARHSPDLFERRGGGLRNVEIPAASPPTSDDLRRYATTKALVSDLAVQFGIAATDGRTTGSGDRITDVWPGRPPPSLPEDAVA
jgi:hypothetical protein